MPETTTYYGHIDKAEGDKELLYMEFHCMERFFADNILSLEKDLFYSALQEKPSVVITLSHNPLLIKNIFAREDVADTESQWVMLNTNKNEVGLEASLFVENIGDETTIYLSAIIPLAENDPPYKLLHDNVSLEDFGDADEEALKSELERNKRITAEFIGVYNVGQGNCNAVCADDGVPLLYFDLGGGCFKNKHTYKTTLDYCFSKHPTVLLSHWDTDHFESAIRNPSYKKENWIVPRQPLGPLHLKFFLSITGTKLIWPKTLSSLTFHWGEIILCTGPSSKKNHSGLAFMADINPATNTIKKVLLPADAAYTYIPGSNPAFFDAVVATHHGAEFDISNSPVSGAKGKRANAFSFGVSNTYSHPRIPAVNAHVLAGWPNISRRDTDGGHIALADNKTLRPIACGGSSCSLKIIQKY